MNQRQRKKQQRKPALRKAIKIFRAMAPEERSDWVEIRLATGIELKHHVLAYVDILGQSDELEKLDNAETAAEKTEAVLKTFGVVLQLREMFEHLFPLWQREEDMVCDEASVGQPPALRRKFDEWRESRLHAAHFSDSLSFYSPLCNERGHLQVGNVYKMVVTLGALTLIALSAKRKGIGLFRGAVEIGDIGRFPKAGDPYGPALAKAVKLEESAAYPRTIVGPDLVRYISAMLHNSDTRNHGIAADLCQHIAQDQDGQWIVDFLAPPPNPQRHDEIVAEAFAFVQTEKARFENAHQLGLAERYARLEEHFRKPLVKLWETLRRGPLPVSGLRLLTPLHSGDLWRRQ